MKNLFAKIGVFTVLALGFGTSAYAQVIDLSSVSAAAGDAVTNIVALTLITLSVLAVMFGVRKLTKLTNRS